MGRMYYLSNLLPCSGTKNMKQTFFIKNMVCDRCKSTVFNELSALGYDINSVELGQIVLNQYLLFDFSKLSAILKKHGFEIIKDEREILIEELKIAIINKIENQDNSKTSTFLINKFNKSYSVLSKTFSKSEGVTIQEYEIKLKIEKVKEMIQLGQLNFSQISYILNYKDSSHLARQFKNITGTSMTVYKSLQIYNRKSLDKII